jgi:mycothiol synthase
MSDFDLRAPRPDDAPALVELINRLPLAVYGSGDTSEAELRHWWSLPTMDLERDARVVERDGLLTAYADVGDQSELHTRYWLDLRYDPEHATAEEVAELVEWSRERAQSDALPGAVFRGYVDSNAQAFKDALETAGLQLIRHSYWMAIDLDGSQPDPVWPGGIEIRTFRGDEEARAVYQAHMESFADSWEHTDDPYDEWEHWSFGREDFDATLWFLAADGDELAGIALCRPHETRPDTGWVSILGVRRPWRRRGIGRALLLHVFAEFARRGATRVELSVDAQNLTGANRLYEGAGMRVIRRLDIYEHPEPLR